MDKSTSSSDDDRMLEEASDGFFLAAAHGRSDVIKALADHAQGRLDLARIIDRSTGRSPLHVAVLHRKTDALRVLLAAGFPPQLTSVEGGHARTPYALAVEMQASELVFAFHQFAIQQVAMNDVAAVRQLLDAGIAVDLTDGAHHNSLVHWAVTCRAVDVLRFLLEHDRVQALHVIDQANSDGATPLHVACRDNLADCVRLLLQHGADPRCTGTGGFCKDKTPRDLIASAEVRAILDQHEDRSVSTQTAASSTTATTPVLRSAHSDEVGSQRSESDAEALQRSRWELQMEEKDILIRQLKNTIEVLVVEAQEIRKLGEERVVLEYVRKLREEKEVLRRELEDAEDHIQMQHRQIQELKTQIRHMSGAPKSELSSTDESGQSENDVGRQESDLAFGNEPFAGVPEEQDAIEQWSDRPRSEARRAGRDEDISVLTASAVEELDGEVIMTV